MSRERGRLTSLGSRASMAFRALRDCGFGLGAGPVSASLFGRYCLPFASLSFLAMFLLPLRLLALVLLQWLKISRRWRQHHASQPDHCSLRRPALRRGK